MKKQSIFSTLLVFHLDISGNDIKEEHSKNKLFIFITFSVFQQEISGNDVKNKQ